MPLRLVDAWLPDTAVDLAGQLASRCDALSFTPIPIGDDRRICRAVIDQAGVEGLLDAYESHFDEVEGFRAVVLMVEASVPKPPERNDADDARPGPKPARGVSVQELYEDVAAGADIHIEFVAQVVISTLVAAIGLARDLPAVVIGAMVIAPLLGPHMALALATTLVDWKLAMRALRATMLGMSIALAVGLAMGFLLPVDPDANEIASRTGLVASDVVLALGSGAAGALAFRSGLTASIVGVMVAVALMPPAVTLCLMAAAGRWRLAAGAGLLLATNIICVNLAGVITFAARGVRPRRWHEERTAARLRWIAVVLWILMLAAVLGGLALMESLDGGPS